MIGIGLKKVKNLRNQNDTGAHEGQLHASCATCFVLVEVGDVTSIDAEPEKIRKYRENDKYK